MSDIVLTPQLEQITVRAGNQLGRVVAATLAGFRTHAALYMLAFTTCIASAIESRWLGVPVSLDLASIISGTTFLFLFVLIVIWLAGDLVRLALTGAGGSPRQALQQRLLEDILAPGRVSNTIHAFVTNGIFFVGFSTIKNNIPLAVPFSWDRTFSDLDRLIHFGVLPHELLAPIFASPLVTAALSDNYKLWFVVLTVFFFWQGFRRVDTPLRQRFLLAYMLTWAIATCLLGTIFASAGPCFYGYVNPGPDPYADLVRHLRVANDIHTVLTVKTQELLWESHINGHGLVEGISAMPSTHVAMAVLFFLCARATPHRWLVWFTGIFAVVIFLSSIHLGWHYAVDGYMGAAIAWSCWRLADIWVKRSPAGDRLSSRPS